MKLWRDIYNSLPENIAEAKQILQTRVSKHSSNLIIITILLPTMKRRRLCIYVKEKGSPETEISREGNKAYNKTKTKDISSTFF